MLNCVGIGGILLECFEWYLVFGFGVGVCWGVVGVLGENVGCNICYCKINGKSIFV